MKIIRHSDDLGITAQSTKQILEAWQKGYLDGFSIIANSENCEQISTALQENKECRARIAIHFNLSDGYPSAPTSEVPLLVDGNGKLKYSFCSLLLTLWFTTPSKKQELYRQITRECLTQIQTVQTICHPRVASVIDSHNYIHMIPSIFSIVAKCALDAGISEIRIADEPFFIECVWQDLVSKFWWINLCKHFILKFFSIKARRCIQETPLQAPDTFIGILYSGRMSANRALCGIKAKKNANQVEVLFHIGRSCKTETIRGHRSSSAAFHLSHWRDKEKYELELLTAFLHTQQQMSDTNIIESSHIKDLGVKNMSNMQE